MTKYEQLQVKYFINYLRMKKILRESILFFSMIALILIASCKKNDGGAQSIKPLDIEINQNTANHSSQRNLMAISGLRLGDPISKINAVLGCDGINGKWEKFTQPNSEYEYFSCIDESIQDIELRSFFRIAKTKDNKIKAISCRLMLINESTVITRNSAYFKLNHSACNTQSFGLLSPIFESSTELDSVSKILGKNPKIEKLDVFDPFADFLDNEKVMRLEYDGINIYSMRDKVVGIELLDTEAKNWKKDWK